MQKKLTITLDEDVDVLIADLLKAYGFSTLTMRDADQLQNSDADQLALSPNSFPYISASLL